MKLLYCHSKYHQNHHHHSLLSSSSSTIVVVLQVFILFLLKLMLYTFIGCHIRTVTALVPLFSTTTSFHRRSYRSSSWAVTKTIPLAVPLSKSRIPFVQKIIMSATSSPSALFSEQTTATTTIQSIHNDNMDVSSNNDKKNPFLSIAISDSYDGGNIKCIGVTTVLTPEMVETATKIYGVILDAIVYLEIKPDPYTELERTNHFQYFSFRSLVTSIIRKPEDDDVDKKDTPLFIKYILTNAKDASYADGGFQNYQVFYSKQVTNPDEWRRNQQTYYNNENGGELSWIQSHPRSSSDVVYFSYFPPYSYERHLQLIEKCCTKSSSSSTSTSNNNNNNIIVESLGQSIEGRDIECITIGTGPLHCWMIHRQHPGEHMAEYYAEGLLHRLLQLKNNNNNDHNNNNNEVQTDQVVETLLQLYTFHIVPNMCPDGAVRGHLRTNAMGANLNREWDTSSYRIRAGNNNNNNNNGSEEVTVVEYVAPTLERSPEVYYVLNRMIQTGCDIFLDIHGDEALPFNFCAQPAVPNFQERLEALHGMFVQSYCRSNHDMQIEIGYPVMNQPSTVFNTACKQIAYRFNCLAITLEMPFKDCVTNPDSEYGWNPKRSMDLGASVLEPLLYVQPYIRSDPDTWIHTIKPEDQYIRPTYKYKK